MKRVAPLFFKALAAVLVSFWCTCAAQEVPKQEVSKDDAIFVSGVEGSVRYESGGGPKQVGVMEKIPQGASLKIPKNGSVFLSRIGYKTIDLTSADSPYTVDAGKFEKDDSIGEKTMEHLGDAVKYFVYRDSDPLSVVRHVVTGDSVEGDSSCRSNLRPINKTDILYRDGESLTLKWDLPGQEYYFGLYENYSHTVVYQDTLSAGKVEIPMNALAQGKKYIWSVSEVKTGAKCSAVFRMLGEEESAEIMENLNNLRAHLPAGANQETRSRMQAAYLASELLIYDAWRLLEQHGIKP